MACGIPVIASDFDTFKNFIERNHCGFNLDPFDIRRVASTMVYFIKHPTKAKAMGANGIKMIRERYNWDIEKSKLLQLYKNL
jgi:glycosyltransferase involved in cell wall biosynthesis